MVQDVAVALEIRDWLAFADKVVPLVLSREPVGEVRAEVIVERVLIEPEKEPETEREFEIEMGSANEELDFLPSSGRSSGSDPSSSSASSASSSTISTGENPGGGGGTAPSGRDPETNDTIIASPVTPNQTGRTVA